jgi:hypothetical protein
VQLTLPHLCKIAVNFPPIDMYKSVIRCINNEARYALAVACPPGRLREGGDVDPLFSRIREVMGTHEYSCTRGVTAPTRGSAPSRRAHSSI